jgi:hypothetical protein
MATFSIRQCGHKALFIHGYRQIDNKGGSFTRGEIMHRIKNMSRGGWIVVGIVVAMMLVPSGVAVAAALKYTGIEGTSGNKADVTPAGELQVAAASPSAFFQNAFVGVSSSAIENVGAPPASLALVVTTIHIDTFVDPSPGSGQNILFLISTGTSCSGSEVGSYIEYLNPGGIGETDIPMAPGLGIPEGDSLCAEAGGSVVAEVSVSGFTVPAAAVSSGPIHSSRILLQTRQS